MTNTVYTDSTKRNVGLLAACQALLFTNNSTLIAINGLAGLALAPRAGLATLPVTGWIIGSAIATLPASLHMKRVGRQRGLSAGIFWGIAGAIICAAAIGLQSFWLLCFGTLVWGVYNAYGQYYRFAAADAASVDFRPTAISLVLAGGLVGGILGPGASQLTIDLIGPRFMGAYLALIGVALATLVLLRFIRIPDPGPAERLMPGRPLHVLARQPAFILAVLSAAIAYGVMNFLMVSTPIAMGICGHPYSDAAFVVSGHVVGMFAPSFITGPLIRRVGVVPVLLVGAALNFVAIGLALSGVSVAHFWWSLAVLGVGWNFLFIGATTLLISTYRPEERARAQGVNDLAIFVTMAISSVTSGLTVTAAGWERVNLSALPLVAVITGVIVWYALQMRRARA